MNDTRRAILDALAAGPVSGPELSERLAVSRAAIWKHVEALREAGFEVESGSEGYVLESVPDYNGPALEYGLDAPFAVEYHDSLPSTNARARELAAEGATDAVVVADEQTGGRGRLDRGWSSPPGGIWLSMLSRPSIAPARAPLYTLAGAVATARAVRSAGVDARIKWPNDVVLTGDESTDYRKLAGVLTEMEGEADRIGWLIVGVGLNANVDSGELPEGATTLRELVGDVDRRAVVHELLSEFDALRGDLEGVVPAWRELTATIGRRVRVDAPGGAVVGRAVDVTDSGGLVIETGERRETVAAGDCEHLRPV
ncbi:biotin--[acetyl-CoA-carboxylase] ligase [Saliphagus sp. LR7]|uniref:biotin--[acetyl-CoA-carboxylase] ligase n=1 Tax=Saliphagus sp. LR7 TaxID=2282654 RepID=UPI000DF85760|nr:biotin--[acetyl-CoA-carboxylase] ligase [Saliphagus sp. LR7]